MGRKFGGDLLRCVCRAATAATRATCARGVCGTRSWRGGGTRACSGRRACSRRATCRAHSCRTTSSCGCAPASHLVHELQRRLSSVVASHSHSGFKESVAPSTSQRLWFQRSALSPSMLQRMHESPCAPRLAKAVVAASVSHRTRVQLGERVRQDWETRCKAAGPGGPHEGRVDGLTVRVVNITEKAVEVKPQFRAQFDRCPSHFKFKQKVILLFQAIEGVDVLLFIVFVQVFPLYFPPPMHHYVCRPCCRVACLARDSAVSPCTCSTFTHHRCWVDARSIRCAGGGSPR